MTTYDLVVVGAGPGGYVCAIRAAQMGMKVALVEQQSTLGGTCLNVGCIPSKALLESSERVAMVHNQLASHGITVGDVSVDLATLMQRKTTIVKELTDGLAMLMKKNKVDVVQGTGTLERAGLVSVAGPGERQSLEAKAVCLAMGSEPMKLGCAPFDGKYVVSSTEALCFDTVPKRLLVIGAGALGLELGSVWLRLGSEVTVVEMLDTIVPGGDAQMLKVLHKSLVAQGFVLRLGTQVLSTRVQDNEVKVTIRRGDADPEQLCVDRVLVGIGRRARVDSAGIEQAGVLVERGRVVINDRFETSVPGVYAIGDLVRGPMLAHKASEEGVALAELLAGNSPSVGYHAMPAVVYTEPEYGVVGLSEQQAKEQGIAYKTGKCWYQANGRAKSLGDQQGLVKLLADSASGRLIGAHIVGTRASELIGELSLAMRMGATVQDIAATIHPHPSLSELIKEAALAVNRSAIHS